MNYVDNKSKRRVISDGLVRNLQHQKIDYMRTGGWSAWDLTDIRSSNLEYCVNKIIGGGILH